MKTKEEIRTFLRQKDADGISVYHGGRYETKVKYDEDDVIRALSDFAAQSVREYKEKLKSEILARFKEHMAITPVKDLTELIESTH